MTRAILLVEAVLFGSVVAQTVTWTGKAHGYKGTPAELWTNLDRYENPDAAIKIGTIDADGRFSFALPTVVPNEVLAAPDVREDCGDFTLGLKLAVLATVNLRQDDRPIGQMFFSNRRATLEQMAAGQLEGGSKFVLWFYANRAGTLKENCKTDNYQQISDVTFVQGWNAVMGYFYKNSDGLVLRIRNGYTEGLQRWFYLPSS